MSSTDYRLTSNVSREKSFNSGCVIRSTPQCNSSRLSGTFGRCESAIIIVPSRRGMTILSSGLDRHARRIQQFHLKTACQAQIRRLPNSPLHVKFNTTMSVEQIERAIDRLPDSERDALESRLFARRFGLDALSAAEGNELVASLEEAERDIDEGRTYNGDQLRQAVRSWVGK